MVAYVAGRATGGDQDRVHAGAGEDAARALARAGTVGLAFLLEPVLHHSDLVLLGDDDAPSAPNVIATFLSRSDRKGAARKGERAPVLVVGESHDSSHDSLRRPSTTRHSRLLSCLNG